jgi:hypothetical protein
MRKILIKKDGLSGAGVSPEGYKYLGDSEGDMSVKTGATVSTLGGGYTPPYKVYTALLTQEGENAPVATVLENTLGTVSFSYNGVGDYTATLVGGFISNKTALMHKSIVNYDIGIGYGAGVFASRVVDVDTIQMYTSVSVGGTDENGILENEYFEIRVYN